MHPTSEDKALSSKENSSSNSLFSKEGENSSFDWFSFNDPSLSQKFNISYNSWENENNIFSLKFFEEFPLAPPLSGDQIEEQSPEKTIKNSLQKIKEKSAPTKESSMNKDDDESLLVERQVIEQEESMEEHSFVDEEKIIMQEKLMVQEKIVVEEKEPQLKKCKCKNSRCVQMYCECFKNNMICGSECSCFGCQNISGNENKIAKIKNKIKDKDGFAFIEDRRYTGCKCTKNHCELNYCECYRMGVLCGKYCKCRDCENCTESFKRKQEKKQKKGSH